VVSVHLRVRLFSRKRIDASCFFGRGTQSQADRRDRERKSFKTEIEELFMPFRFVEYETGSGVRSAVGLYLCREIVRLHNGTLRVEEHSRNRPEFVMELAR